MPRDNGNSNITIQGNDVTAGSNLVLKADNDINLLAAQNVTIQLALMIYSSMKLKCCY
ncbi:hemagglutinin repeat-containing protein [Herbaspirillum chlorophenolicum]|uniref:Hemagglutinin repeat-containing protein n=1 Tax=Herbaspirillum chlorophenolicum TaxID=211589 RepID=A0ABW8EY50_9BURK